MALKQIDIATSNVKRWDRQDRDLNPEDFPILADLPELVVRTLQRYFYAGVKQAEVRFKYHRADEDTVTGGLAERLIEPAPLEIHAHGEIFRWTTAAYKLRGRGANAPEKEPGADGIFQIVVVDQRGRFVVRKGLLFQSKIEWHGRNGDLLNQARRLIA